MACKAIFRFPHPYPATKLQFIPDKDTSKPDLLATAADYLRIWQVRDSCNMQHMQLRCVPSPCLATLLPSMLPPRVIYAHPVVANCLSYRVGCLPGACR